MLLKLGSSESVSQNILDVFNTINSATIADTYRDNNNRLRGERGHEERGTEGRVRLMIADRQKGRNENSPSNIKNNNQRIY